MKTRLLLLCTVLLVCEVYSQTTFQPKVIINDNTGANPYVIESGLLDNDSNHDIILVAINGGTVEHYKGDGTGSFVKQTNLNSTPLNQPIGIGIGDVDNSNGNDVLIGSFGGDKVIFYENNGDGTFANGVDIITGIDGPTDIMIVNLDDDANDFLDLVIPINGPNGDTDRIIWMEGNGDGTFNTPQDLIPATAGTGPGSIDLADLDEDGDLEMVVGFIETGNIEIYNNRLVEDGSLAFEKYDNPVSTGNVNVFYVSFGDLNDDNNLDVTMADSGTVPGNGRLAWYNIDSYGSSSTTFTENLITVSFSNPTTAIVTDLDNDTNNDLLVTHGTATGAKIIWLESNDDGTLKSEQVIDATQTITFDATVEDFDNDGDLDIASLSFQSNDLTYYENNLIVLGIEDYKIEGIKIHPNPSLDKLTFEGLNDLTKSITIFNNVGQKIIETFLDINNQIDVSGLARGLYLLKIKGVDGVHKMVKN